MSNILNIYGKCGSCKIGQSCLANGLVNEQLERFENIVKRKVRLDKNSYLARPGEKNQNIYVIKSGIIKSYGINIEGKQEIHSVYQAGDFIGLETICRENHLTFLQATDNALVCEIPYQELEELYFTDPTLHRNFMTAMSRPLLNSLTLASILRKKLVDSRIASYLLELSNRQGGKKIALPLSRKDTSVYLRTSEETLSRIMSRFRKDRLIEIQYDSIHLKKLRDLKKIAGIPSKSTEQGALVQSV